MKYVKFTTEQEALDHMARLQAHHDEEHTTGPRLIDTVIPSPDGQYATTLQDADCEAMGLNDPSLEGGLKGSQVEQMGGQIVPEWQDIGNGEIVDTIEPPVEEGPE